MKTCKDCFRSKPFSDFPKHPTFSDGLDSACKSCRSIQRSANRVGGLDAYMAQIDRRIATERDKIARSEDRKRVVSMLESRKKEVKHLVEVAE